MYKFVIDNTLFRESTKKMIYMANTMGDKKISFRLHDGETEFQESDFDLQNIPWNSYRFRPQLSTNGVYVKAKNTTEFVKAEKV